MHDYNQTCISLQHSPSNKLDLGSLLQQQIGKLEAKLPTGPLEKSFQLDQINTENHSIDQWTNNFPHIPMDVYRFYQVTNNILRKFLLSPPQYLNRQKSSASIRQNLTETGIAYPQWNSTPQVKNERNLSCISLLKNQLMEVCSYGLVHGRKYASQDLETIRLYYFTSLKHPKVQKVSLRQLVDGEHICLRNTNELNIPGCQ